MNCDAARAAIVAGATSPETDAHVGTCPSCRAIVGSLDAGRSALSDAAVWEEPAPELSERIVSMISARPPAADAARPTRWAWLVAGAAAVLIAVVAVVAVTRAPAPDWEVTMRGTDLASEATSDVAGWNTDAGTRMRLTIEGLPPAPIGTVYELWLSNAELHVSAGTFTAGGEIELWTGVPRSDYPRLWVTIEPLDTDESPSGRTVLDTG